MALLFTCFLKASCIKVTFSQGFFCFHDVYLHTLDKRSRTSQSLFFPLKPPFITCFLKIVKQFPFSLGAQKISKEAKGTFELQRVRFIPERTNFLTFTFIRKIS